MATSISKLKTLSGKPPTDDNPVDNRIRADWNNFLSYLDKKGLRGKPDLDKGGAGYAMFDQYVKENPSTSLSREKLPVIRKELLNYRNWVLEQNKTPSKNNILAPGVTDNNFMRHVLENEKTGDPNYPGSNLTTTPFPQVYLSHFMDDKKVAVTNEGFATTNPVKYQ